MCRFASTIIFLSFLSLNVSANRGFVYPHPAGYYGGGAFIGQAVRHNYKGIFTTHEYRVNWGGLPQFTNINGVLDEISEDNDNPAESEALVAKFKSIEGNCEVYVFKYIKKGFFNPEYESHHYQLKAIEEIDPTAADSLPQVYEVKNNGYPIAPFSYGAGATADGVLVDVERWGYFQTTCTVVINQGGNAQGSHGLVAAHYKYNIYSEEGCKFAEALLPAAKWIRITYSEEMNEIWHGVDRQIHKFEIRETPDAFKPGAVVNVEAGASNAKPLDPTSVTSEQSILKIIGAEPGDSQEVIKQKLDAYILRIIQGRLTQP